MHCHTELHHFDQVSTIPDFLLDAFIISSSKFIITNLGVSCAKGLAL